MIETAYPTRREMMLAAGAVAATQSIDAAQAQAPMSRPHTFVLCHGSYGGGWIWRYVADRLRAKGHRVFTPTYTGLGERSHLMSGLITLDTHITDVANVIKWERLENVVLVGHSYGGWVVSGVAERTLPKLASLSWSMRSCRRTASVDSISIRPAAARRCWRRSNGARCRGHPNTPATIHRC